GLPPVGHADDPPRRAYLLPVFWRLELSDAAPHEGRLGRRRSHLRLRLGRWRLRALQRRRTVVYHGAWPDHSMSLYSLRCQGPADRGVAREIAGGLPGARAALPCRRATRA